MLSRVLRDTHPPGYLRLLGMMFSRLVIEPKTAGGHGLARTYCAAE